MLQQLILLQISLLIFFSYPAHAINQSLNASFSTRDEIRANSVIETAAHLIDEGQWRESLAILSQAKHLSSLDNNKKTILLANIALQQDHSRQALAQLKSIQGLNLLSQSYQRDYHRLLARAYDANGRAYEAVQQYILLDNLLDDDSSQANNRRFLWLTLTKLSTVELKSWLNKVLPTNEMGGWVELALISKQQYESTDEFLTQLEQWKEDYPDHPAHHFLPKTISELPTPLIPIPKQIALLLPLSGPFAGPGHAVREGFMAAASSHANSPEIYLYDTAAEDVVSLYQRAIEEGADYVIGPLNKKEVTSVAALEHPIPTLLLNENSNLMLDPHVYQLSLSPQKEAEQVAMKANKQGYHKALVIAPSGVWGDDVVISFSSAWAATGGVIVDKFRYSPQENLTTGLRDLLRFYQPPKRTGQKEMTPTRRQDFDMIFLLAYPSMARQIVPLLKYYYLGNTPIYATSAVYGGSADVRRDKDLDEVIFCDMSWVFYHQMPNRGWSEQLNSYSRLYALGVDSYSVATQSSQLQLFPSLGMEDNRGALYLNRKQQIARMLVWGRFNKGAAVVL